jgi:trk system potassium uptake protein TrkA
MYIIIVGAGKLGYYLTKDLLKKNFEVTLMDWNRSKVAELDPEFGENIIYGNGSSLNGLEKAGCCRADVIVAATGHDEDNLVICQMAKRYFKVKKAIARINNPKNESVFKKLGVGTTVSSTKSVAEAIEHYMASNEIMSLLE